MTTRLEKPVKRLVKIRGHDYVVELSQAGIMFRRAGRRVRMVAPIGDVLSMAANYALQDERREQLRKEALRRAGR